MRYRRLDANGDYTLGLQPRTGYYSGNDAVVQAVVTRLNLLLGEWWENLDDGLPLFEEILGQYNSMEDVALVITERIAGTTGVERVYDIETSRNPTTRLFQYSCSVDTAFGDTVGFGLEYDGKKFTFLKGG